MSVISWIEENVQQNNIPVSDAQLVTAVSGKHYTYDKLWGTFLYKYQPLIQWVPGALSLGVKRSGREADHSPPSSAEVKE
jgi:hypothetical protein